ncbi:MAG TPA: HD-GYP domain-containing protein [Nitrospiraceae bacterium]|nr:HD-GYP domain-containing protein [Nitrospiraceae bacterium]
MIDQHSTQWYQSAVERLTQVAAEIQRQDVLDLKGVSVLASNIVESLGKSDQLLVEALAGPSGPPLLTNLVNVGILATKVGVGLGYYGRELERLALAGLMHDVGLFAVPQSLVTKSGRLTPEERMLVEQHPELGYQALRKLGPTHDWLAQVVRQAHERWNGRGYPNKLKGRQITEFAQIIGVVDVFDALVSPRPYRRRFFPHEAVRELMVVERTAFPREVMKALVEQLSAYPIGTSVRLSTGELGTVIRVNTRYPLRPAVMIRETEPEGLESRHVDLSTLPLVTIIETVEPPDIARLSFPTQAKKTEPMASVSDQFSSLLESLDAIASAIQGVVESAGPGRHESDNSARDESSRAQGRTASRELVDASFEKEVVGLFALEAHEWLAQIQTTLKKLSEGANQTVRPKLYGIILQGITNLAKSAATVQLSAIEQMASNLLPILQEVGRQEPRAAAAALNSLHEGLARISMAVHRLTGGQGDEYPAPVPVSEGPAVEPASSSSPANHEKVAAPRSVIQASTAGGLPLLTALRELHQARARSVQPTRDVLEAVILMAEHEGGDLEATSIDRILNELNILDEEFVEEVRKRVPVIIRELHNLRSQETTDFVTATQLDPIVREVDTLHDLASRVQASMMTMFLQGLQSFLLVTAYRKASTLPQRLEMVEARMQALIPMAEQWVNIGRLERAAISEILPA